MVGSNMKHSRPWVVRPAIGNPAIVIFKGLETTFEILLAAAYGESQESLSKSLTDKVCLVRAGSGNENYTLTIREDISSGQPFQKVKEIFGFRDERITEEAVHKFESSDASKFFGWHLISSGAFPPPVNFFLVTLSFRDEGNIPKVPEGGSVLFSLKVGEHLKPNSIYLTNKDWKDFTFIHATDLHVAKRNDDIQEFIEKIDPEKNSGYINFNKHIEELISQTNAKAERGELDFIFLTGDLLDFILTDLHNTISVDDLLNKHLRSLAFEGTNWFTLYKILTGEDGRDGFRVPIVTLLGNHDYRVNHYNLDEGGDKWKKDFGLTKKQFERYKKEKVEAHIEFPEPISVSLSGLLWYFKYFNSDLDYQFSLGHHHFICLDTGPDKFDADNADSIRRKIIETSPAESTNSLIGKIKVISSADNLITKILKYGSIYGFSLWALPWLLLGVLGGILLFVCLHIRHFKFLYSILISLFVFLAWFIIPFIQARNIAKKGERALLYNLGTLAVGLEGIAPGGGPDSSGLSLDQIDWIRDIMDSKKNGLVLLFVCMHTPPINISPNMLEKLKEFNETNRRNSKKNYWIDKAEDDDLSVSSIYRNWAEFLDFLAGIMRRKAVDLVLCGHIHQNIEFRIESYLSIDGSPARLSKKKVGICTDLYSKYINAPNYRPYWWNWNESHPLTLVLQTTSLGPRGKDVTMKGVEKNVAGYRIIEVKDNSIINIESRRI